MRSQPERPPTFDVRLADRVRHFAEPLFLDTPELRGIAVCLDWHGELNGAALHGLWLCEGGVVSTPAGVFGGVQQTMKMLETQVGRALELQQHLLNQVHTLAQEAAKRHEEIEALDRRLAERGQARPQG